MGTETSCKLLTKCVIERTQQTTWRAALKFLDVLCLAQSSTELSSLCIKVHTFSCCLRHDEPYRLQDVVLRNVSLKLSSFFCVVWRMHLVMKVGRGQIQKNIPISLFYRFPLVYYLQTIRCAVTRVLQVVLAFVETVAEQGERMQCLWDRTWRLNISCYFPGALSENVIVSCSTGDCALNLATHSQDRKQVKWP